MRVFSVRVKFLEEHIRKCQNLLKLIKRQYSRLTAQGVQPTAGFGPPEGEFPTARSVKVVPNSTVPLKEPRPVQVSDIARQEAKSRRKARRDGDKIAMHTHRDSYGQYTRPLMGPVKTDFMNGFNRPPPKSGETWKKYWYFFRTRGVWKPSEHHPYGDEIPVITDWLNLEENPEPG
jgi:hypothetical protein